MSSQLSFPVYLPLCARLASALVVGVSIIVFLGWWLDIPAMRSGIPGLTGMNPGGTALSFLLAAASLWLLSAKSVNPRLHALGRLCAAGVLTIALSYFFCRATGCEGPDTMFFREKLDLEEQLRGYPNRMAPNTAGVFILTSVALIFIDFKTGKFWPAQMLALCGIIVGLSTITGYAYNAVSLAGIKHHLPMALNTGICFVLLNLALLCARPARGLVGVICSNGTGGFIARRLLPIALTVPSILGWFYHVGAMSGMMDEPVMMAMFSLTNILLLATLIWWIAAWLESADQKRRMAEEMLKASEERFQLAVRGSNDGLWDWDIPANRLYWSERFKEMLGIDDAQFQPSYDQFKARLHPDERDDIVAQLEHHTKYKTPYDQELRMRKNDGDYIWVRARGSSIWNEDGVATRTSGSVTDITGRKEAEEAMRQAQQVAENANNAKSEFLANMSHELRTPLNSIIGLTRMIYEDRTLADEHREMIGITVRSADNLLDIVNDILDLSKVESGMLELEHITFSLKEMVDCVVETTLPLCSQKDLIFDYRFNTGEELYFRGDALRLGRVVTNLLSNAIKYTENGSVTLEVNCLPGNGGLMILRVGVIDTGIGIAEDKQRLVFEKFIQADTSITRRYGGTGLGLSITKQIVEKMGGTVGLQSTEGVGSHFWFEVPLETADERTAMDRESFSQSYRVRTSQENRKPAAEVSVLVAEDHQVNQAFMRKLLGYVGINNYLIVDNGKALLEAMEEKDYDLALVDCHMPTMSGYDATAEIRRREDGTGRHIPLIAMTADAMVGTRERCLKAGMDDYISKPINHDEFRDILLQWIELPENERYVSARRRRNGTIDPAFDVAGLRKFADDEAELRDLINTFIRQSDAIMTVLRENCVGGENEQWTAAAHKFKGGAAMVKAEALRQLCDRAQSMYNASADERAQIFSEIEASYSKTRSSIDRYLAKGQ